MKHVITAILFFIGTAESAVAQKDPLNHEMVFVEGGTFQMGRNSGDFLPASPVHSVALSSFNIGKYEVTQAQWKAVMGSNPSLFTGCDNCPVETVSWNDIQDFIRKLNVQTNKSYRLPTEAEWEYAARGGNISMSYIYSGSNEINSVAWYKGNSESRTHSVGSKQSNELGIYDMSGNVFEWCSDWYGNYDGESRINPMGAFLGQYRVLRGGFWGTDWYSTARNYYLPGAKTSYIGFRMVLPFEDESIGENVTQPIEGLASPVENKNNLPLIVDDAIAEYPGGSAALYKFISENLVYPEDAVENGIEGKVIVKFVVDVDGVAKDFEIERTSSGGQSLEGAALEVCKRLGKFKPTMQKGKPVKSYYSQAIVFQLAD